MATYTVTGVINLATRQLIVAGTYEGHLESVCQPDATMTRGYQRWAGTFEADSWQDAETQARADCAGVWAEAGQLRDGDTLVESGGRRRVVDGDPAALHHAGRSEVVIHFRDGTSATMDASTQVQLA